MTYTTSVSILPSTFQANPLFPTPGDLPWSLYSWQYFPPGVKSIVCGTFSSTQVEEIIPVGTSHHGVQRLFSFHIIFLNLKDPGFVFDRNPAVLLGTFAE